MFFIYSLINSWVSGTVKNVNVHLGLHMTGSRFLPLSMIMQGLRPFEVTDKANIVLENVQIEYDDCQATWTKAFCSWLSNPAQWLLQWWVSSISNVVEGSVKDAIEGMLVGKTIKQLVKDQKST